MALVGGHRRDAEQRPAGRGPGREVGGVDAGLGDVHPVGRQRVQLEQPAPGPRAGRDDGGGGREDRALPRPASSAVVGRRRWPSGMCTSTTSRSRLACGTSTSGAAEATSPSSSTTAPSGIRCDDAGEGGERRRVGSRPGAGHGVLVHRPAERGEPAADLAVVGVAAARPGRVVDAVGHDDVHRRHSGRS